MCYLIKYCYIVEKIKDWPACLREKEKSSLVNEIRWNTKTGRPCGGEGFILRVEKLLGRRMTALPWGRPRKVQ